MGRGGDREALDCPRLSTTLRWAVISDASHAAAGLNHGGQRHWTVSILNNQPGTGGPIRDGITHRCGSWTVPNDLVLYSK